MAPSDTFKMLEVGRAARLFILFDVAHEALQLAQAARAQGRGRRPSAREVARLEQRVLIASGAYQGALESLGAMALAQAETYEQEWRRLHGAQAAPGSGQAAQRPTPSPKARVRATVPRTAPSARLPATQYPEF